MPEINQFYYNVLMYNDTGKIMDATYSENRQDPILDVATGWEVAVARFSIPSVTIPIFLWQPNIYYIGLYNGTSWMIEQVTLQYKNVDPTNQKESSYVYNYQLWIDNINYAFQQFLEDPKPFDINGIPIALYDNELLSIIVPYDDNKSKYYPYDLQNPQGIEVYMSNELYLQFFPSLDADYNVYKDNTTNQYNLNYRLRFHKNTNNYFPANSKYYDPDLNYAIIENKQQYPSTFSWTKVRRLVFYTNSLQVQKEYIANNSNGKPLYQTVLTDFELPLADVSLNKTTIYYQPSEFRWMNFTTDKELRAMDLTIYYQTYNDLELRRMTLPPNFDINIKLAFRKSSYYLLYRIYDAINNFISIFRR